ncbi:MAG: isoprenylcysteine carboxylmethyltransferase family protein [Aeromicrobium sp.]
MSHETGRGAKVTPTPPPVIYGLSFLAGIALHAITDDSIGGRPATAWLGAFLMVVGVALAGSAVSMFVRAHTTVIPHHRVSTVVTSGPFRISRNPMYTAFALLCLGGALAIGTWWPIVTLVPALVVIVKFVIRPEERYLSEAFGPDYAAYCQKVRRWL